MIKYIYIILALGFASCKTSKLDLPSEQQSIIKVLDRWHQAAGSADFKAYFDVLSEDAIFMGTDATEHWDKTHFMEFSKPYFDRGKAWNFKSLQRHIYFDPSGRIAWFDELLDTQMKICRGSGVMQKQGNTWKIKQYVLSMTVPNEKVDEVVREKDTIETKLILNLINK